MADEDIIIMSQKELKRVKVINEVMNGCLTQREGAKRIGISDRQVRRLLVRVAKEGDRGLIHKLRGKGSNRGYPRDEKEKVLELCRKRYAGFGPTLCMEKLSEREKNEISDEALRKWFIKAGIEYKGRRKGKKFRQWRERKEYFGEMVQMDGSHHDWLEGRFPEMVLMAFIDDATGKIFCRFYNYEGTIPALDIIRRYVKRYGVPHSVYLDKHSTYKSTEKLSIEDELAGKQVALSQYERALREIGINVIHANSPQAKGRVERLFNTLQDRLIKEMRLEGIVSIEGANKFLEKYMPAFNERFGVQAAKGTDLHREVPKGLNLDEIFCIKTERVIRGDFTVNYDKRFYQILDYTGDKRVTICESLVGSTFIMSKGKRLRYKEIFPAKNKVVREVPVMVKRDVSRLVKIPVDYSWRRSMGTMFAGKKIAA